MAKFAVDGEDDMTVGNIQRFLRNSAGSFSGIDGTAFITETGFAGKGNTSEVIAFRTFEKSESKIEVTAFHHFVDFLDDTVTDTVSDDIGLTAEGIPVVDKDLPDGKAVLMRIRIDFLAASEIIGF